MKGNARFLTLGLCAMILLSVVSLTNVFAADESTIIGTVHVAACNVGAVSLMTSPGEKYAIVNNDLEKALFKLDKTHVKASGIVGEDSDGNKTLTVTSYEIIQAVIRPPVSLRVVQARD